MLEPMFLQEDIRPFNLQNQVSAEPEICKRLHLNFRFIQKNWNKNPQKRIISFIPEMKKFDFPCDIHQAPYI